jgi:hypothetical protein
LSDESIIISILLSQNWINTDCTASSASSLLFKKLKAYRQSGAYQDLKSSSKADRFPDCIAAAIFSSVCINAAKMQHDPHFIIRFNQDTLKQPDPYDGIIIEQITIGYKFAGS